MIYIIGENSFLAKNLYKILKNEYKDIFLLSHTDVNNDILNTINDNDIIINFCGINRANTYEEYNNGNYIFIKNIIDNIKTKPFLIHISSLMVYGFKNKENNELVDYQKWFIETKMKCENYLINYYDNQKLSIVRPSNIFGYDTIPYYNNILSTLVYEKINNYNKINNININCVRNMLSVKNFSLELLNIIKYKKNGVFNIISNNNIKLIDILNILYDNNIPKYFNLNNNDEDILNLDNKIIGQNIIINEDLYYEIKNLEELMKIYLKLKEEIIFKELDKLTDSRGTMIEISNLNSTRLYKITLNQNVVRGNHYHLKQIEEFYNDKGKSLYLFSYYNNLDVIYILPLKENYLVKINPNIIHTITNDYINNISEIYVLSTQKYIKNEIPDTVYIKIIS